MGGQVLHLHAGPQDHLHKRVVRMASRPLHRDLVGDAGDHGHEHDARHDDQEQLGQAVGHPEAGDDGVQGEDGVHQNGDDHHHDEKGGAAAHVQARELPGVLGRHGQPVLEAVDGLVLGAVVHEHALDVLHAPDEPDIEHEYRHTQKAVHDVPGQGVVVVLPHDEVRHSRRRHDEQHHTQHEPHDHGDHHLAVPELLFFLARLGIFGQRRLVVHGLGRSLRSGFLLALLVAEGVQRGDFQRLEAQHERLHERPAAAHERPVHPAVLVLAALQVVLFHVDGAARLAHGHGPVVLAAHHHALDEGLAAHVGLNSPVLGKGAGQVALLLCHGSFVSLFVLEYLA